jgi:peptidoglycan biosynthesis protein MviN/MurJ (putative lipid II flippase)
VFISILIALVAGIISMVLSIFSFIPFIGSVMVALAATIGSVFQMVFAFILYQDKKQLIQV